MSTTNKTPMLTTMLAVGVNSEDATWYYKTGRARNFSERGDACRAQKILREFYRLGRETRAEKRDQLAVA